MSPRTAHARTLLRLLAGVIAALTLACLGARPAVAATPPPGPVNTQNVSATVISAPPTPTPVATPLPTSLPTTSPTLSAATPTPAAGLPQVTMNGIQPPSGQPGTTITITGSGFSGSGFTTTAVTVGGMPAVFTVLADGTIQVVVPNLPPGTASIVITTSDGTSTANSAPGTFTVTAATAPPPPTPPTITGMSPTSASPGSTVVISGGPFQNGSVTVTSVTVGGKPASYTVLPNGQVQITVPDLPPGPASVVIGLSDGSNSVTAPGLTLHVVAAPQQGSIFTWIGDVISHLAPVVVVFSGLILAVLLLVALTWVIILAMRRRRENGEEAAVSLDFKGGATRH